MSFFQTLGPKIKETLQADAWLGDVANVEKIELDVRLFRIDEKETMLFFDEDDLPAIAITPQSAPPANEVTAKQEETVQFPCEIQVVSRARILKHDIGRAAHRVLIDNLERVIRSQRRSSADWSGLDALTRTYGTGSIQTFKEGDYVIFTSTTNVSIEVTQTF